jgi:hypothetical protein
LPDGNFEGEAIGLELGRSISGGVDITPNFFEPTDDWVVGAPGDVNGGSARGPYKYFGTDPSRRFGSTVRLMQDVTRSSIPDMAIADGVVVHVYPGALTPGTDPVATLVPDGGGEGFGRAISNSGRMNPSFPRNLFMVGAPDAHGSTGKVYIYGDPTTPTDVPAPGAPNAIEFGAPTPNPSPGTFAWSLRLPQPLRARLAVLDLAGREVAKLHDGPLAAGRTDFEWRPAASSPPGIYWGVLEIDGQRWSRRMVRLK